jgi:hypothetical protein
MKTGLLPTAGLTAALLGSSVLMAPAAAVDESKLPPSAPQKIDFARDIKPILEATCLRCHGPERPKSGFRLTDRVSALRGGVSGVDILPGQSAKSPLIHNVAGLVEDMKMPPPGKAPPLTTNQISLLRAWIDQGLPWAAGAGPELMAELSPTAGWTSVHGDQARFRELEWRPEGWNGGVTDFRFQQRLTDGRSILMEGRFLRDEGKLSLDLRQPDLGFARFGFEQFRKHYDSSGGYASGFAPPLFDPGRNLHLDTGRAWVEAGLTLPKWPRLVAGYEYQFKNGDKSMLTWGPVVPPSGNPQDIRNIYPSAKHLEEHTHAVRLEASHDLAGWSFENALRAEFYQLNTRRPDAQLVFPGQAQPAAVSQVQEGDNHFQIANTLRLEKALADWWFLSSGFLYSWLDDQASVRLEPQDSAGQLAGGSAWSGNPILLHEAAQVFNVNSQFRPLKDLTATLGLQSEWRWQDAFGHVDLREVIDPNDPTLNVPVPALLRSSLNQEAVEEHFLVRYTGIPFTALFAEARLKQDHFDQFKDQSGGAHDFLLDTHAFSQWQEYRGGLSLSPWQRLSLSAQYKHRDRATAYDHLLDLEPRSSTAGPGYPGFIRRRDIATDEVEARLTVHPARWLKNTLTYQWIGTDYRTTTDPTAAADVGLDATPGGQVFAGRYQAHVVSAGAILSPYRGVYLSSTISYLNTRIATANHGSGAVPPYRGDGYSLQAGLGCAVDDKTHLTANAFYSRSGYGQNNQANGLPLGLVYGRQGLQVGLVRQFSKRVSFHLNYGYFAYAEPSSGHLNDYTGHQVFALLSVAFP